MSGDANYSDALLAWHLLPAPMLASVLLILLLYLFGIVLLPYLDRGYIREPLSSHEGTGATRITAAHILTVIVLGIAGQSLLGVSLGWALVAFAVAGALAAAWLPLSPQNPSRRSELLLLALAVSVAFLIRIWRLNEIFPQGVEQDEYVWAFDYFALLHGANPLGLGSFGIPVLPGAINALLFSQFGITPFTIRFPSVLYGSITVIPMYYLAKTAFNSRTGFAAVAILVFAPYHVFYSRIISGSRMVLGVSLSCVLLLYGLREYRAQRAGTIALFFAGMTAALASYDYFAVRAHMVFLAVFWMVALACALISRRQIALRALQFAYFLAGFLLLGLPLLIGWLASPAAALGRIEQESLIGSFASLDFGTISRQVQRTALMFNTYIPAGRSAWFSHPAVTYFDFFFASLFAVGAFTALFQLRRRWKLYGSLLLGLLCAVLPTLLSTSPPCSHRAVLSIIPVTLILAMIIGRLLSALERCFRSRRARVWAVRVASCVIGILLCTQLAHRVALVDSLSIFDRADYIRSGLIRRLLDEAGEVDRASNVRAPVSLIIGPRAPIGIKTIHPAQSTFELTPQSLYPEHHGLQSRVYAVNRLEPAMLDAFDKIYPDPGLAPFFATVWRQEEYFRVVEGREMAAYRCSEEEHNCLRNDGDFEAEVFLPLATGEVPECLAVRVADTTTGEVIDPARLDVDGQGGSQLTSGRFSRVTLAADGGQLDPRRLVLEMQSQEAGKRRVARVPLMDLFIPNRLPRWRMEVAFSSGYVAPAIDVPYVGMSKGMLLYSGLLTERMERQAGRMVAVRWETKVQMSAAGRYDLRLLVRGGELDVRVNGSVTIARTDLEAEQLVPLSLPAGESQLQVEFEGDVKRGSVYAISQPRE